MPTLDKLLAQTPTVKALAQLLPNQLDLDDLLQLRRTDEPTRFLIVVPDIILDSVIRYYNKAPVQFIRRHRKVPIGYPTLY